jgi:hypothetical protein
MQASGCHLLSRWFLAWFILRPWRRRRHVPPKRRLTFNGLHGVISQKIELFLTTAVRTANDTRNIFITWITQEDYVKYFYGTQNFMNAFTKALHWALSWSRPPFDILLSSNLRPCIWRSFFPSGFLSEILYKFLILVRATYLAYLIDVAVIMLGEEYYLWSFSLCPV